MLKVIRKLHIELPGSIGECGNPHCGASCFECPENVLIEKSKKGDPNVTKQQTKTSNLTILQK